jgi:hypothetical protein
MRPGLTCLWQVEGRNQIGFDDWVRLDLEYIDNWSLTLDCQILLRTLPAVLRGPARVGLSSLNRRAGNPPVRVPRDLVTPSPVGPGEESGESGPPL